MIVHPLPGGKDDEVGAAIKALELPLQVERSTALRVAYAYGVLALSPLGNCVTFHTVVLGDKYIDVDLQLLGS